jgi:hypothetical protein
VELALFARWARKRHYAVPYVYYRSSYGITSTAYWQVEAFDYLREDTKLRIETNLYAAPGWGIHLDRHQRFVQSEVGAKSNRGLFKLIAKGLMKQNIL